MRGRRHTYIVRKSVRSHQGCGSAHARATCSRRNVSTNRRHLRTWQAWAGAPAYPCARPTHTVLLNAKWVVQHTKVRSAAGLQGGRPHGCDIICSALVPGAPPPAARWCSAAARNGSQTQENECNAVLHMGPSAVHLSNTQRKHRQVRVKAACCACSAGWTRSTAIRERSTQQRPPGSSCRKNRACRLRGSQPLAAPGPGRVGYE